MTYHFLAEALSTPWALQPERMAAYAAVLAKRYLNRAQLSTTAEPGRILSDAASQAAIDALQAQAPLAA